MRRTRAFTASAVALLLLGAASAGADSKWVRGKVTAVAGDTVTVTIGGNDFTFAVDSNTDLIGSGLGTATRRAQKTGAPGLKLAEAVKVGDTVEVHYEEAGGAMRATEIRTGASGQGMSEASGDSASGRVTAISAASLTIRTGSGEATFSVDAKTRVIGRGAGTTTRQMKEKGAAPAITDLVQVGDEVRVLYRTMGSTKHASEVHLRVQRPRTSS